MGPGAVCWWCPNTIPEFSPDTGRRTRKDAKTCSKRCRQSSWRFGQPNRDVTPASEAMRFAYADPPYPGMAERWYSDHPDYAGEVAHDELIERLMRSGYDGWALSTSSKTLQLVLALCPDDVRIGAWTKPVPPGFTVRPRVAWEPVIFWGGRPLEDDGRSIVDWVYAVPPRTYPGQITGIKPPDFSWWVFDSLGARPGDQLDDLFPGSGAVGRAWERYTSRGTGGKRRVA